MAYSITRDDYFRRSQPAKSEELKNRCVVRYSPLVEGDPEEVYRSDEPISLAAGNSVEVEAKYNNLPCKDGSASIENSVGSTFIITEENHYSWGAIVTVQNNGASPGTCELVIDATPLSVEGESFEIAEDALSIQDNRMLEYPFPDNHLIQNAETAAAIAALLVSSFSTPRNDCSVDWRGDMALELADEIEVVTYERNSTIITELFYIYKQEISFDGTLEVMTEGRKKPEE